MGNGLVPSLHTAYDLAAIRRKRDLLSRTRSSSRKYFIPSGRAYFILRVTPFLQMIWNTDLQHHKLVKSPSNVIAGRPKAALLFWVFAGFRCVFPLFIVILVVY